MWGWECGVARCEGRDYGVTLGAVGTCNDDGDL